MNDLISQRLEPFNKNIISISEAFHYLKEKKDFNTSNQIIYNYFLYIFFARLEICVSYL